ncbi:DUF2520 domain-containing protein [bacterium]|nr:DUF2520 domain-containing protein [bacterium]
MIEKMRIGIIGSGNTAWQLSHQFVQAAVPVVFIASRNSQKAAIIAEECGIDQLPYAQNLPECDLLFLCVNDASIAPVSAWLGANNRVCMVHCSGSVAIDALENKGGKGVFYPLQTMTTGRLLQPNQLPVCLEGSDAGVMEKLLWLAKTCGFPHIELDSSKRAQAHLSAVFVNNFMNHLLHQAQSLAASNQLDMAFFEALAQETVAKFFALGGEAAQTGPARRGDTATIEKHRNALKEIPEALNLYDIFTQSITRKFGK